MKKELLPHELKIFVGHEEAETFFQKAADNYKIKTVFIHEETDIDLTYQRGNRMAEVFRNLIYNGKNHPLMLYNGD